MIGDELQSLIHRGHLLPRHRLPRERAAPTVECHPSCRNMLLPIKPLFYPHRHPTKEASASLKIGSRAGDDDAGACRARGTQLATCSPALVVRNDFSTRSSPTATPVLGKAVLRHLVTGKLHEPVTAGISLQRVRSAFRHSWRPCLRICATRSGGLGGAVASCNVGRAAIRSP